MHDLPDPWVESVREERQAILDAALREELKEPLLGQPEPQPEAEPSLEEEMKRLLGELSAPARNA